MIGGIDGGLDPRSMFAKLEQLRASRPDFTSVDRDGSGGVSKGEFQDLLKSSGAELPNSAGQKIFDKIDANGDAELSQSEIRTAQDRAEQTRQLLNDFTSGRAGAPGLANSLVESLLASSDSEREDGSEDDDSYDPVRSLLETLDARNEAAEPRQAAYEAAAAAYRAYDF